MRLDECFQAVAAWMRLHNLCIDQQVPLPEQVIEAQKVNDIVHSAPQQDQNAAAYRQHIIYLFM